MRTHKKPADAIKVAKVSETDEVLEGEGKPEAHSEEFAVIESADERELHCQLNGRKFDGMRLEVPFEWEKAVRETLVAAGYLLK